MIVPDVNLLVYAHNAALSQHRVARAWWEDLVAREQPIGLPWAVAFGFVRIVTHPSILREPLPPLQALAYVEEWLARPHIDPLDPGPRHLEIARRLIEATGVAAGLTTDIHLAALAIEQRAELHSNDADFSRFPGLRWQDPLA